MERKKEYFIGLDLAQQIDFSAYAVLTAVTHIADNRDPVYLNYPKTELLRLRDADLCPPGLEYSKIPSVVYQIRRALGWELNVTLAVDASGPGKPVVDMIKASHPQVEIQPYVIVPGGAGLNQRKGVYTIGRQTLLSNLRVALETRLLRFPGDLHCRQLLIGQILGTSIDGPSTSHDDLVFALALGVVSASTRNPSLLKHRSTARHEKRPGTMIEKPVVQIFESSDPIALAFAKGALDDSSIEYVARNEITQLMNDIGPMLNKSIVLAVEDDEADRARAAIDAALEEAELPDE